jgi:hypothetical protein
MPILGVGTKGHERGSSSRSVDRVESVCVSLLSVPAAAVCLLWLVKTRPSRRAVVMRATDARKKRRRGGREEGVVRGCGEGQRRPLVAVPYVP